MDPLGERAVTYRFPETADLTLIDPEIQGDAIDDVHTTWIPTDTELDHMAATHFADRAVESASTTGGGQ